MPAAVLTLLLLKLCSDDGALTMAFLRWRSYDGVLTMVLITC